jgi:uncharacterized phage protein gp47/JayE
LSGSSGPSSLWRNAADFLSSQIAAVQGALGRIIPTTPGSMALALAQSDRSVALWLQNLVISLLLQTRAATCVGAALDSFYAQFNFFRLGATFSSGAVTVARYSPTVAATVALGSIVTTGPGGLQFQVIQDITNPLWNPAANGYILPVGVASGTIPVQCLTGGIAGNVSATVIYGFLQPIPFIDTVTNALSFSNGLPVETDPAFRARFVLYIGSRSLGVSGAIQTAILGVQQNLTYNLLDNTLPGDATPGNSPGSYTVYVDDGSGAIGSALIAQIYAAIDAVNGFTIEFYVLAATPLNAAVSMEITLAAGFNVAAVKLAISAAIVAFVESLEVGETLAYTRLAQLTYDASSGITNVTNLTLNGGTADLTPSVSQVIEPLAPVVNIA